MRRKLFNLLFLFITIYSVQSSFAQTINTSLCGCDFVIQPADLYANGDVLGVGPGDVVCIAASTKRYLNLKNFHGAPGNPVIIKNCGGQVTIRNNDWYYGFKMDNCTDFILTGSGDPAYTYGIQVTETVTQISGLNIGLFSTDFEVDHIEVSGTGFAGIMTKSDPDCTGEPNRGNFVMKNVSIHDNYVHNTAAEGIYVGFPHYRGIRRDCNGDSIYVLPHDITGLRIYKNIMEYTGREGLQVGCAISDVEIYDNIIRYYGLTNVNWQRSGVHLSTGTTGKFYRNLIYTGSGAGIWLNGHGDNYIYNNLIINPGSSGEDGLMVYDSIVANGKSYYIINNTIVNSGGNGMKVYTYRSTPLYFCNNIVAGAGNDLLSVPSSVLLDSRGNVMDHDIGVIFFEDVAGENFRLKEESPAVDAGEDMMVYYVVDDFEMIKRYRGQAFDAGAYESPHERLFGNFFIWPNPTLADVNIYFVVPKDVEKGSLNIYDAHGRLVAVVAKGQFRSHIKYEYKLDGTFLAQGIYYYVLETEQETKVIKVLHVK